MVAADYLKDIQGMVSRSIELPSAVLEFQATVSPLGGTFDLGRGVFWGILQHGLGAVVCSVLLLTIAPSMKTFPQHGKGAPKAKRNSRRLLQGVSAVFA